MDRPLSEVVVTFALLVLAAFIAIEALSWHQSWTLFSERCALPLYANKITLAIYEAALKAKLSSENASSMILLKDPVTVKGVGGYFIIIGRNSFLKVRLTGFFFTGSTSGYQVNITCTPSFTVIFGGGS